jgi:ABC-2 type transport system ATP-binding protein
VSQPPDEVSFGAAARHETASPDVAPLDAPPLDGYALATRGLSKRFRNGQLAVDGLDLAVPSGAVYGFLGPNGSGKTTTIRMLLGLI